MAANYSPVAGKRGWIEVDNIVLPLAEWRLELKGDVIDVSSFGNIADADDNVMDDFLIGLMRGMVTLKGRYNTTANHQPMVAPIALRPNKTHNVFLGYTSTHGVLVEVKVVDVTPNDQVQDAGNFECTVKVKRILPASGGKTMAYPTMTLQSVTP